MGKKGTVSKIPFSKIVYFDEESATDLIYMYKGGSVIATITKDGENESKASAEGNAGAEVKTSIFSLFKLGASIESSISLSASSKKIFNQAITNTVLTDYLEIVKDNKKVYIEQFNDANVYAYENSMTFYKLMTPFLTMTEGKTQAGEFELNLSLMDEALKQGRGYFEMVLEKSGKMNILRFNLNSFKSSYSLSDLVKMNLTYHAVKVGKMKLSNLDFSKEFSFSSDNTESVKIDVEEAVSNPQYNPAEIDPTEVDVYDVILAGVKND